MYCFNKTRRLLNRHDYDDVFKQAKKMVTSEFIFLYKKNEKSYARLGMALSKKAIAKAHDRNRLKRMLRETFRIRELPPVDIVVLARHGVGTTEKSLIYTKLGKAWDRLAVLCKN